MQNWLWSAADQLNFFYWNLKEIYWDNLNKKQNWSSTDQNWFCRSILIKFYCNIKLNMQIEHK